MAIKTKGTLASDLASILTNGGLLTALEDRGMRTDFIDSLACLLGNNAYTGDQAITGALSVSGGVTPSDLTASRILLADAAKKIVSADTATYPSLTELAYLKGVTSSVQTQLNSKGSILEINTTPVGNVGGGTDDLQTYSVPGGTLSVDEDYLEFEFWGTMLLTGVVTSINALFGAMALLGGAIAIPTTSGSATFCIKGKIIRLSATTQIGITSFSWTDGSAVSHIANYISVGTETLSGAVTLKMQATATNNNDVSETLSIVTKNK